MGRQGRKQTTSTSPISIPLAHPNRSGPVLPTLYDLAAAREAELQKQLPDYSTPPQSNNDGPLTTAIFYSLSLSMLHITFDVLVHQQYAQLGQISWPSILGQTKHVLPILGILVYTLHTKPALSLPRQRQWAFAVASVVAGCYLVYSSNRHGYFAVMRRAPPLGTLLVWEFLEMRLRFAVGSLLVIAAYTAWSGYSVI